MKVRNYMISSSYISQNSCSNYLLHGAVLLEKLTGSAASQEIPRILSNPKVHYRIHKCPPPGVEESIWA